MLTVKSDVTIIGGGPAGLQAGIYTASEGLSTLLIEEDRIGGQIRQTPKLENFAGQSPDGVSGPEFVRTMKGQCERLGVHFYRGTATLKRAECCSIVTDYKERHTRIKSKAIIIATGARWGKLEIPGVDEYVNKTFHYGPHKSMNVKPGGTYIVVGRGNSAGQAIITLATHAEKVYVLVRSGVNKMSAYLKERINKAKNVEVLNGELISVYRYGVMAMANGRPTRIIADHTFFCGTKHPNTEHFCKVLNTDEQGFLLTGYDLPTQTNVPGIFAIGDVRAGVRRQTVGNAIADANTVMADIIEYFNSKILA